MSTDLPIDGHIKKIRATVNNERRLKAVNQTSLVNTLEEESFDRLTRLASKLLNTPISFVTLLEKDRDFVKSHYGLPVPIAESREITAHPSFCQHIVDTGVPLVLDDARESDIFKHFPSVQHLGVVAYAGVPLTSKLGFVLGTCCVVDYKKRIWTEDELEILLELSKSVITEIELREAGAILEEFVSIAAHEIKTPLTCMKMYTELLERNPIITENEELKEDVSEINGQMDRLNILIDQLFDTGSIKNGGILLEKDHWDLIEHIAGTVHYFEKQHSTQFVLSHSQPNLLVHADKDRLAQVIRNLISNAIKYAPQSDIIEITITNTDSKAIVSVKDFGPGISEADRDKIFDRFYRAQDGKKVIGLGLGLYICSDILKAHNGTLTVSSEIGEGSTFSFTLPLQQK